MTTASRVGVSVTNRLVGSLPKVGIRPAIDGRRKGVRESLEGQTMGMAQAVAKLISDNVRHACGAPVECVIADTCIGGVAEAGADGRKVRPQRRRRLLDRLALLVLRLRDDGYGPGDAKGRLGLQRHRAAGGRLSGRRPGRAQPKGPARLRHLRPRRARPATKPKYRPTFARRSCASSAPAWPPPRCVESPISRWATFRWASPARWSTTTSSSDTWA